VLPIHALPMVARLPMLTIVKRLQTYLGAVAVRSGFIIIEWMWYLMNASLFFSVLLKPRPLTHTEVTPTSTARAAFTY